MPARAEQQLTGNKLGDAEKVLDECSELESELAVLQVSYEQFFLGMERRPPAREHAKLKKKVFELRTHVVRSVVAKVRVANLATKLATYERLWERTLKEMESGTYRRDLFKARLHAKKVEKAKQDEKKKNGAPAKEVEEDDLPVDEDLDMSDLDEAEPPPPAKPDAAAAGAPGKPVPPPAKPASPPGPPPKPLVTAPISAAGSQPPPPRPPATGNQPALRPVATGSQPVFSAGARPGGGAGDGLSEQKIKAIYDAYVMAKRRCGEDTSKLSLQAVSETLKKQVPELMKQHKAKSVEFKVVIKDGKAVLRALPKE